MKQIHTIVQDIYDTVQRKDGWFDDNLAEELAHAVSSRSKAHFSEQTSAKKGALRLSQMGPRCPRALWYSVNKPGEAESLPAWAIVKYSYGHLIEALAITLAKGAGHEVTGEQDELIVDGIVGHRDCVIDGCVVDVKSSSSLGMEKFRRKTIAQSDSFGYLDQLDGYLWGSREDDLVRVKDKAYILAVDKTLGHMVLYEHIYRPQSIQKRIATYKEIVALPSPPPCECGYIEHGKSGNLKLDLRASYSPYKFCCNPNIRTFLYSEGPVYLVKVNRKPDVIEVDRFGNMVYN